MDGLHDLPDTRAAATSRRETKSNGDDGIDLTLPHETLLPPVSGAPDHSFPDVPAAFDEYRIKGEIGRGGSGVVYEAEQRSLRRDVAVKVLHDNEVVGWNLVLEGRIAGGIEHPNIVPVHALVLGADGRPMLVMKRLSGLSWDDLARDPEAPLWSQLLAGGADRLGVHLDLTVATCNALAAAHKKGILHLDVKPANVVVAGPGETFLTDWGCATSLAESSITERKEGMPVIGTPAFMAPEMLLPGGVVDERSDVYLVGAALHTVLVGRHRNPGSRTTEVLAHLCAPTRVEWPAGLPVELRAIIETATAWRKEDRQASVAELRDDVLRFVHRRASFELTHQTEPLVEQLTDHTTLERMPTRELSRRVGDLRAKLECALVIHPGNERAQALLRRLNELRRAAPPVGVDPAAEQRGGRAWRFDADGRRARRGPDDRRAGVA